MTRTTTALQSPQEPERQETQDRPAQGQQDALAEMNRMLVETFDESVGLHQRSLALIEAVRRDVERIQRQLRRMSVARS